MKKIADLPIEERPYEKCMEKGPTCLSNEELLAVILRTGTKELSAKELARNIITKGENTDLLSLMHYSFEELMKFKGIGRVKAIQIMCIGELSKRIACTKAMSKLDFSRPDTIATYYMERMRHKDREELLIAYLNTKCQLIKDMVITSGTINQSLFSVREIFVQALKLDAVNIIIIHNHPSGNSSPSNDDIVSTKRICEAGKLIGITVLDHIIIGDKSFTSLNTLGII